MNTDFMSNEEFYATVGIDDVKTKMMLSIIPKWLLGPIGYAIFVMIAVLIRFRKVISAFIVGGIKSARKEMNKGNKKHKKKKKKKY